MTCDERIEKLLNKAGQTISDLPKRYEQTARSGAFDAADQFGGSLSMTQNFEDYILHLTDVIDRLEWALDKTIRERDYLKKLLIEEGDDCDICVYADVNKGEMPCYQCDMPENHFEYAGIPEDWRADDGAESDT